MTRSTGSSGVSLERLASAAAVVAIAVACLAHGTRASVAAAQSSGTGTIKGRVKLTGPIPANPILRMGIDPMCSRANGGKRLTQQMVVADAEGGLANVVVQLEGELPA